MKTLKDALKVLTVAAVAFVAAGPIAASVAATIVIGCYLSDE